MKNSSVCISWPCRLKIGAKSKKDPHVRIVGKPEDVQKAKECVLASLDSRVNIRQTIVVVIKFETSTGNQSHNENGRILYGSFLYYWPRW